MAIPTNFTSEQVRAEFGLTLPMTSEQVRAKANLTVPWTSAQLVGKSGVTLTISGYVQQHYAGSNGWDDEYETNGTLSVTVAGGTATAYRWTLTSADYGSLYIAGSSTGRSVYLSTGRYANWDTRTSILTVVVTIGGVNYTQSTSITYEG